MSDRTTEFGSAAYSTLVSTVRQLKADDALRLVTVLVPSEHVGVAARRALAAGEGRPGIAAVQVLTLRRLAESLAAADLVAQGRRPLTTTSLAGAVRDVLRDRAGLFEPVAQQIGTVRALAEAHRSLRAVPAPEQAGAGVAIAEETVRIHRDLLARTATTTYDEADLLRAARDRARQIDGPVVAFLLHDLDPDEQALLEALPDRYTIRGAGTAPTATRVLHASDPDDEVRAALREVMGALRQDVPGHRIAVLYGSADPYARLLHEHLRRAGITYFGRGIRSTLDNPIGRGFLRMLELPDHGFRRDEVLAWIADAPVRRQGRRAPSSRWERASRAAGVVKDQHWDRLRPYADQRADRNPAAAGAARGLADFVDDLRARFAALAVATSWTDVAAAARALWEAVLAPPDEAGLSPDDDRAVGRVRAALDGIERLAGDGDLRSLRELLELQLADDLDRVGKIGVGVHVGAVADGYGAVVDRLVIVGAAEGVLPTRPADDPLLPDRVRVHTAGVLPTTTERVTRQRREFDAALAAAPDDGRTVSFPRGDLRGGGERVPSRWLLPSLRLLSGNDELVITGWADAYGLIEMPSYSGAVLAAEPATPQEWRQRAAATGQPADDLADTLRRLRARRRSPEFTAFAGNLRGADLPDPTEGAPISPSALEQWAKCPWAYFVGYLLRAEPVEQPEDVVRVSALVRGNLVHRALEGLVDQARAEGWAPEPHQPWPPQSWDALERHARAAFAKAETDGLTGFPLLWEEDSAALLADLRQWLTRDDERRARLGGLTPLEEEWSFGGRDRPAVSLDLGDGRQLHLRGTVDRIDADGDGRLVVTDYKTGKRKTKKEEQVWDGGRRLQLPLYALAAAKHFGHPDGEPLRAAYWYTSRREGFRDDIETIDDAARGSATDTVRAVVDAIVHGVFPARPTADGTYYQGKKTSWVSCAACDPDGLGELIHPAWEQLAESDDLLALPEVHALLFPAEDTA